MAHCQAEESTRVLRLINRESTLPLFLYHSLICTHSKVPIVKTFFLVYVSKAIFMSFPSSFLVDCHYQTTHCRS